MAERLGHAANAAIGARAAASAVLSTAPFSLMVHAYSNISLQARVKQSGREPGDRIEIYASLAQSGIPLENGEVRVEVTPPVGGTFTLALDESRAGQFKGSIDGDFEGVYRLRVRASGTTRSREPFTREKTLTAAIWRGHPVPNEGDVGGSEGVRDEQSDCLCRLLMCLLQREGVISAELEKRLKEFGINLEDARKCVEGFCRCQKG